MSSDVWKKFGLFFPVVFFFVCQCSDGKGFLYEKRFWNRDVQMCQKKNPSCKDIQVVNTSDSKFQHGRDVHPPGVSKF